MVWVRIPGGFRPQLATAGRNAAKTAADGRMLNQRRRTGNRVSSSNVLASSIQWDEHRIAIANLIAELHNGWRFNATRYQQTAVFANICGVIVALLAIAVAVALSLRLVPQRLRALSEGRWV